VKFKVVFYATLLHISPKTALAVRNGRLIIEVVNPDVVYVQFFEKDGKPAKWKHPDVPGTSGVYPVKKDKVNYHVAGNQDQPVKRFQIPLVPGLTSTIHVAQGTETSPIIKLDETMTPTHDPCLRRDDQAGAAADASSSRPTSSTLASLARACR
jgi:hypothetical protein